MNRTEYHEVRPTAGTRMLKDLDAWIGNSLALVLSGLAVACGVVGMLVAFAYIREDNINPFEVGIVWLVAGLILAITANAFRREHHVVDPDERRDIPIR